MEINATTTATAPTPLVISDLSGREFNHPESVDLLTEFDKWRIGTSEDLQAAIDAGYLVLTNENGVEIGDVSNVDIGPTSTGKTIHVTVTGDDDTADGSLELPYRSVGAAITAASALSPSSSNPVAILVYPGIYTETAMTLPSYVNMVGVAPVGSAIVVASVTTQTTLAVGSYSTVSGMTFQGAGGSGGIGVSVPSGSVNFIIQQCVFTNNETGCKIVGSGVPLSTLGSVVSCLFSKAPTQAGVTALDISAGALVTVIGISISGTPASLFTTGVKCNGAIYQMSSISINYCTTGFNTLGGSDGAVAATNIRSCTTGIKIDDSTTTAVFQGSTVNNCTTHLNITDPDAQGQFTGNLDIQKTNISDSDRFFLQSTSEEIGEEGLSLIGNLALGAHNRPSRGSFGEGGATAEGEYVFTNTNGTAGTWADITEDATTVGTTFSLFPGTAAGNCIYVGVEGHAFPAVLFEEITTALVIGTGSLIAEYWNGSAWTAMKIMQTIGGEQYGNAVLMTTGENVTARFGNTPGWATSTLNGQLAYWTRWRIVTAITTVPQGSRLLHMSNCFVIGRTGYVEYFGDAQPTRPIPLGGLRTIQGFTAPNYAININANQYLALFYNGRDDGKKDGSGSFFSIPLGLDTSKPITFHILWAPKTTGSGNVENELYLAGVDPTDVLNGAMTSKVDRQIDAVDQATAHYIYETEHTFLIPTATPQDEYFWSQIRDATAGNADDTYGADTYLVAWALTGTFWR